MRVSSRRPKQPEYMDHCLGTIVLRELRGVFNHSPLTPFLIQGTALGAYRDNGFTPTEKDIDLGFLWNSPEDSSQLHYLAFYLMAAGFEIQSFTSPFNLTRSLKAMKYGVKVDIVGWLPWKGYRFTHNCDRKTKPYAIVHRAAILENLRTIGLHGIEFPIPSDTESYLEAEYGEDWKTPVEDSVSRTRRYRYLESEGIPSTYMETRNR